MDERSAGCSTLTVWYFFSGLAIGLLLVACSDGDGNPAKRPITFSSRSDSLCHGLRTDNRFEVIPALDKPAYLEPYTDPVFGTRVVRISDTRFGEVVKPMYSTIQTWNADESLMILYHTSGEAPGHYLYDGQTYERLKRLDILTASIEEVFWHHSDPASFFYISALFSQYGSLMKYNTQTDTEVELANFAAVCGDGVGSKAGNAVMMPSWDDNSFGFRCGLPERDVAFSYHVDSGRIARRDIGEGTRFEPWYAPMPGPSGERYLLNDWVLSADLSRIEAQLDFYEFHSHSSIGRLANGNDALFATGFDPSPDGCRGALDEGLGALIVHDLSNGRCRPVISASAGYGDPISGTHISATGHQRPGWVALSTIGYEQFSYLTDLRPAPVLLSEIYLADTDPDKPEVCRLAHHRSHAKGSANGGYNSYLGEPHATMSPSGSRIVFGSDWHDSGSVDSYVIELPAYEGPVDNLRDM
ncbi:MAG: hypothetical protein KDJ38_20485 [Gammaproteobacteria bacterium]|nr:hypothetical protein [Gammaproteobacteria bacterium]